MPAGRPRGEIEASKKWDPSAIFESTAEWEDAFASLEDLDVPEGRDVETPSELAAMLETYEDARRRCGRLWAYARLRADEDVTDSAASERLRKAGSLLQRLGEFGTVVESSIREFDEETLLNAPELDGYEHYIRDVRRRGRYALDDASETVERLRPVLEAPDDAFRTFVDGDYDAPTVERPDGETVAVTPTSRDRLLRHPDRAFRRAVHEAYHDAVGAAHDLLAGAFGTAVERNVGLADLRGYGSAREAALDEDPGNDLGQAFPVEAHETMLSTVRDGLDPYHRYYEVKRDRLGVDSLRPWDRSVPVVSGDAPAVPYERATELVVAAVEPLGEAYQSRLRSLLDDRRVDVHETPTKTSEGLAYTLGVHDTGPYLLLNYGADLRWVFILAHELGHAMHLDYASDDQPRIYSGFPRAVAELPSNLHEVLLAAHLADSDDPSLRSHAIATSLERFEDMFFRHALLSSFTQRAHERAADGDPVTAAWLDETYADLLAEFQAPLDAGESAGRAWVGDNQAHRQYDSYQYVLGRAGAHAVADRLATGELRPETYRSFLSAGTSAYPTTLFDRLDIEVASPEPYERAIAGFERDLDAVAGLG